MGKQTSNPKHIKPDLRIVGQGEDVETAYLSSLSELKRYISRMLPNASLTSEVDDIAQEVFLRAYTAKKNEKLEYGKAYLFKVARHLSFNASRKRKRSVEHVVEDFVFEGVAEDVQGHAEQLFQRDRLKALNEAMATLPPKCREVFFLRHFEGLSHKEISKKLTISTSTVEKHIAKALLITSRHMQATGFGIGRFAREKTGEASSSFEE